MDNKLCQFVGGIHCQNTGVIKATSVKRLFEERQKTGKEKEMNARKYSNLLSGHSRPIIWNLPAPFIMKAAVGLSTDGLAAKLSRLFSVSKP